MTNFNKKNILLVSVVVILSFSLWLYFSYSRQDSVENNGIAAPDFNSQLFEEKPRQYLMSYLNSLNEKQLKESSLFSSGYLGKQYPRVYAAYYLPNNPKTALEEIVENYNHPESEFGKTRAGVLVFVTKDGEFRLLWESGEFLSAAIRGATGFKDIDNDGIDELVLTAGQGIRLVPALWIYKWDGDEFILINPNPGTDKESDRWMAGISAQLEDINGDKILEAVVVNEETSLTTGEIEPIKRVYKFNGEVYKLWKEEKIEQ